MSNNKHGTSDQYFQPDATAPRGFAEDQESVSNRAAQPVGDIDWAKLTESLGVTVNAAVEEHLTGGRTVFGIGPDGLIVETRR